MCIEGDLGAHDVASVDAHHAIEMRHHGVKHHGDAISTGSIGRMSRPSGARRCSKRVGARSRLRDWEQAEATRESKRPRVIAEEPRWARMSGQGRGSGGRDRGALRALSLGGRAAAHRP